MHYSQQLPLPDGPNPLTSWYGKYILSSPSIYNMLSNNNTIYIYYTYVTYIHIHKVLKPQPPNMLLPDVVDRHSRHIHPRRSSDPRPAACAKLRPMTPTPLQSSYPRRIRWGMACFHNGKQHLRKSEKYIRNKFTMLCGKIWLNDGNILCTILKIYSSETNDAYLK